MKSILSLALLISSASAFFTQRSAVAPPSTQASHGDVPRHRSSASIVGLDASKSKRKVASRTRWSEARGYGTTDDATALSESAATVGVVGRKSGPRLIIAGAPASGKGTQCELIRARYGVVHLSTGDMLRAAVSAGTDVGRRAKDYMDSGRLVPDDVIIGIVKERLDSPDCAEAGWLLDGFPRTLAQAEALAEVGISADCFIFLNVPDEVLVERVVGRRTDPVTGKIYHMTFSPPDDEEILKRLEQRSDDTEEKVKVRLGQFHANVEAVRGSYADIAVEVDGTMRPEEVSTMIMKSIDAVLT
ncbi:hypothetical protein ACHAXA_006882 [Cyclostephanos tholiformis]|uniref:Adenylate kinase n=1 Tax=Cyclostephanos tholiformis TaxID=382380 RepID=A0ABD3SD44_9STRA